MSSRNEYFKEYLKEWRKKNKEKIKLYNERYWTKRLEKEETKIDKEDNDGKVN